MMAMWKIAVSRTEAEKLIRQGAGEWNGGRVEDPGFQIDVSEVERGDLRVGKRKFLTVIFK